MNERIKELAEQAGLVFWEMSGDVDWRQADKETLANFAELIVLECARKIDDMIDNGWYADTNELKKHFGVES